MTANSRDLVNTILTKGSSPERMGLYEAFWPETLQGWIEQGYPTETQMVNGKPEAVPVNPAFHFGYDMVHCGGLFDVDPIQGYRETLEETDDWEVVKNGAGAQLKYWKHKSGTPEHVGFAMSSRAIWDQAYRPHLLDLDRRRFESGYWKGGGTLAQDRETLARAQAQNRWCSYGHVFLWEVLRQDLGDVCLYESLLLDPGWIRDFNRVYTDFFKIHFAALFDELGLPDGIWIYEDLGYKVGLAASPKVLGELVFPYYAELVDFFHGRGLPVVLHSCGNITEALPMIVDAGFDALNPMEVKAGCDTLAFAEQYGADLAFVGGFDVRILEANDHDLIRREVTAMIEGIKARGARYLFHTDHSISPRITYDTYRVAVDTYREHMVY